MSRFDLQLTNFGVDINELKRAATERVFHAYTEDWEEACITRNDVVPMTKLKVKYKGLKFLDADNDDMELTIKGVVWRKKNRTLGIKISAWYLQAVDEAGEELDDAVGHLVVGVEEDHELALGDQKKFGQKV